VATENTGSNILHAGNNALALIGAGVLGLLMTSSVMALDWKIEPSVSASATATDNGGQSSSGSGSMILSVTPAISVRSTGSRRVQASLSYNISAVERFGDVESNDLNHYLSSFGKAELVDDFLFVEGTANVSQALKSLLGAPGDTLRDTGNLATVGTYLLSPYVIKRFGTFGSGSLRYRRSGALFETGQGSNIESDTFEAGFGSGTQFKDLSWGFNYLYREATTQNEADTRFERYSASLGYALSRKLRLSGTVGYDNNDYLSATDTSGEFWSVGATWAPSRRTTLDASFGERYFGNTYGFGLTHRSHFTVWNVRYSEDVNDPLQQLLSNVNGIYWLCPGTSKNPNDIYSTPDLNPPRGQTNCAGPLTFDILKAYFGIFGVSELDLLKSTNSSIAKGVFILKSLNGSVIWSRRKLTLGLNVFDSTRIYPLFSDLEDNTHGFTFTGGYRLDPHTSLSSSLGWTNNLVPSGLIGGIPPSPDRDDDVYTLTIGVNRQFQPDVGGSLSYRHQRRESSDSTAADFAENSLTATVHMRF
jgi:uncharacterized protein (PEP-CTERM system associated)